MLAERQKKKNPLFGATYSTGLDPELETCHLQALNVKKIPCWLWALGPFCSSPSPEAAVRERSKWGKVQSLALSSLVLAASAPSRQMRSSCRLSRAGSWFLLLSLFIKVYAVNIPSRYSFKNIITCWSWLPGQLTALFLLLLERPERVLSK